MMRHPSRAVGKPPDVRTLSTGKKGYLVHFAPHSCVHMDMHTHANGQHTHIHTYTHTHTNTNTHTHTHTHKHTQTHTHTHTHTHTYTYTYTYKHIFSLSLSHAPPGIPIMACKVCGVKSVGITAQASVADVHIKSLR
jgi:hypothetical protein